MLHCWLCVRWTHHEEILSMSSGSLLAARASHSHCECCIRVKTWILEVVNHKFVLKLRRQCFRFLCVYFHWHYLSDLLYVNKQAEDARRKGITQLLLTGKSKSQPCVIKFLFVFLFFKVVPFWAIATWKSTLWLTPIAYSFYSQQCLGKVQSFRACMCLPNQALDQADYTHKHTHTETPLRSP